MIVPGTTSTTFGFATGREAFTDKIVAISAPRSVFTLLMLKTFASNQN